MKKNVLNFFLVIISNISFSSICFAAAVTNHQGDLGRFGDNLFCYIKAKYLAHKYELPFFLNPFVYSDKFKMDDVEQKKKKSYDRTIRVTNQQVFNSIQQGCMYSVSFHCDIPGWNSLYIDTWKEIYEDQNFLIHIKDMLSLKNGDNLVVPPKDMLSVAVHVRRPSGSDFLYGGSNGGLRSLQLYDTSKLVKKYDFYTFRRNAGIRNIDTCFHFKFLPDQYYIDQIKYISERYNDVPMYIFIFTDYPNQQELIDRYKALVQKPNIIFDTRSSSNYVAEDMISMTYFDCLIRSDSNFSQMAELLGKHKIVISPKSFEWYQYENGQDCLVITERFIMDREADAKYIRD